MGSYIAPPNSASLDTKDAGPQLLKIAWSYKSMAPDKIKVEKEGVVASEQPEHAEHHGGAAFIVYWYHR